MTTMTTMTPELYAIIGVGLALAGVLVPASNRQSRDIAELRQQVNQLAQQVNQQINQLTQQVGHLSGVVEGLRGRPTIEAGTDRDS